MKRILLSIFLVLLLSFSAWADTDIIHTFDSGGGKNYSSAVTWEDNTDAVDFSTDKVMSGINVTVGSFPVDGIVVDDGAGNSGTIYGVKNSSNQAIIGNITGTIPTGTAICDDGNANCFTCTSIDAIGRIILYAYDSQAHDEGDIVISGASNTDSSHYRMVQSAPDCTNPWDGTESAGAQFVVTSDVTNVFKLDEAYATVYNIGVKWVADVSSSKTAIYLTANQTKVLGCLVYECYSSNAYTINGIRVYVVGNIVIYNNIIRDNEGNGFNGGNVAWNQYILIACNTSIGNGGYGFVGESDESYILWSNYAANNTSGDFQEDSATGIWHSISGWNASKDTTADLDGEAGDNYKNSLDLITGGSINSEGIAQSSTSMSAASGAGDNYGRNPYDDVSASYDFVDFLRNDTTGSEMSKEDINGTSRPDEDAADSAWHVGADQYAASSGDITALNGISKADVSSYLGISSVDISTIDGVSW